MALDAELGPDYPEEPAQDSSAEGVPATDSSLPLSPAAAHEADRAFREGHRAIAPGGPDGVDSGDDEVASAETSERFVADTRPATPTTLATARAVLADAMQENTSESADPTKHEETSDQQEVKVEPDVSEPMEMATQAEVSDAPATVDETPRPEASPLSAEEVPQHASDLLRQLQEQYGHTNTHSRQILRTPRQVPRSSQPNSAMKIQTTLAEDRHTAA